MKKENFDFIIIGAGVAGLAAAMYGGRLEMKTLCLGARTETEFPIGGTVTVTDIIENYPGFIKLSGAELAMKVREHAQQYKNVHIREEKVLDVEKKKTEFVVKTDKGEYNAKAILLATGTKWRKMEVKGEKELTNKGVSYCALCDGPLYKGKAVAVTGGSDSAAKNALVLAEYAKKVYIIYRGEKIRSEPVNLRRIESSGNIEIINKANVIEIKGKQKVESVILDRDYNGSKELMLDGVFVSIGRIMLSDLAKKIGAKLNVHKEIITNKHCETSVKGVYAAGDVTDTRFKQAISATSEGCIAAYNAFEFIKETSLDKQEY